MLRTIIDTINRLMRGLGAIAASLLIALVFMLAFNVIMRYAFDASSIGLEELSWHFYAAVFLLGIPYALQSESHVRVDLVFDRLSPRKQAIIDLVGTLIFLIPTCLIIIWAGWNFTAAAYQLGGNPDNLSDFFTQLVSTGIGEKSQDPGGLLNRWIIKGVIPLAFAGLLLAAIAFLLERVERLRHTTKPDRGAQ
ncbi:TRAP transporter small permease subunit [Arenicella xantha]|uniref:TRAP transporter small permease protein n=1 Tax=Arenicella xantha TaxID=644221 RepID=A0A395JI62_9GAMM|nr:TRAP transporter small permease subunit [Arenicella xantha]RBP48434.1 TRAP-type mannitol/chloroaromatic compound transport system permease small subunit [Arenicella xantha]